MGIYERIFGSDDTAQVDAVDNLEETGMYGWTAAAAADEAMKHAVDVPVITWKDVGNVALDFTPVVGDIKGGYETVAMIGEELEKDDPNWYLIGAMGGIGGLATIVGLVPGAGDAAQKALMSGARSIAEKSGQLAGDVTGVARAVRDGDLEFIRGWNSPSSTEGVGADVNRTGPYYSEVEEGFAGPNLVPESTRSGYKLMRKPEEGRLTSLFVNQDQDVPTGQWMDAIMPDNIFTAPNGRKYAPASTGDSIPIPDDETRQMLIATGALPKGSTAKTVKAVAARPGHHLGDAPNANHIGPERNLTEAEYNKLKDLGYPVKINKNGRRYIKIRGDDEVWVRADVPDDVDWQSQANRSARVKKDGTVDVRTAEITDELPRGGSYDYRQNSNNKGNWVISGQMKVQEELEREALQRTNKEMGRPLDSPTLSELDALLEPEKVPATVASQTEDLFSGADIAEIAAQGDMRVPYADPTFGPTGRLSTRVPKVGTPKTGGERPDPSVYGGELTINKDVMDEAGTTEKNMELLASGREQSTDVNRKGQLIIDPENNPYQNIGDVPYFPGFKVLEGMSPEDRAKFVSAMQKENLEWVMNKLPKDFQDRAKLWYTGANRFSDELANRFGLPRASVSGVIAALSPQKDWFQNASMAERVLDAAINNRTFPWSSEMTAIPKKYDTFLTGGRGKNREIWKSIKGKSYDQLETIPQKAMWIRAFDEAHNPKTYRALTPEGDLGEIMIADTGKPSTVGWGSFNEIEKAVAAMESGGDFKILSDAMGGAHKVRNFFNNIEVPFSDMGDVTIDTHAIAAALMRPLAGEDKLTKQGLGLVGGSTKASGARGNYGFIADDYREVASDRGLLPREVQSITWEGVRGLFNNKSDSNKRAVNTIWSKVDSGELTQQQALDLIESAMGGFADTTWINEPRPKRSIAGGASTMFNKGGYVAPAEGNGFATPK
jgi:hypothetical protein